ncbi:MAG: MerC domain-containing protein [Sphingobium sp.]|mgnify:CR=1 FL=1|nr:MerC domain-containing protein [Sphingobium sp.]MCP5398646.1 MerC domain-containing protein [Sphingomonas sp.]
MFFSRAERPNWDRLAIGLSGLCVLHCVGTLVFLGALSSLGHIFAAPIIHEMGLALAIAVGAIALGVGAMRHGRLLPVAVGSLGLGVMAGALSLPHGDGEALYTVVGVATVAFGHYLNLWADC